MDINKSGIKNISWKQILKLQAVVFVYSFISMLLKYASLLSVKYGWFSWQVALSLSGILAALAVYAYFWQKIIKKMDLSVAYSNKALGLFWTLMWAALLFEEKITWQNVLGMAVVCAGVFLITGSKKEVEISDRDGGED